MGPHPPRHLISDFFIWPSVCAVTSVDNMAGSLTSLDLFPNLLKGDEMLSTYTAPGVKAV